MRVLHFSDVHVGAPPGRPLRGWLGKRAVGGLNLWLRRRRHFAGAVAKLGMLDRFRRQQGVELVLCTGDYTALGMPDEFAAARRAVEPLMQAPAGYVHVPGNHDLYMPDAVRERWFEQVFPDTFDGDFPEHRRDGPWPLVRLIGDRIGVIAVNSARPNPAPWRSNGRIPDKQLRGLRQLLRDPRLEGRYLFVMTHYAPRLADGGPDTRLHGLLNAEEFLDACRGVSRGAILCGHLHHGYRVELPGLVPAIYCAGSATLEGREFAWLFDVTGEQVTATPVRWVDEGYSEDLSARVPA